MGWGGCWIGGQDSIACQFEHSFSLTLIDVEVVWKCCNVQAL